MHFFNDERLAKIFEKYILSFKVNINAYDSNRGKSQWTISAYYLLIPIGVFPLNFSRCKTFIDPIVINTN